MIDGEAGVKEPGRWQRVKTRAREFASAYSNIPKAFSLVWASSKGMTIVMVFLTLGFALLPPVQAWIGKLIVDRVVALMNGGTDPMVGLQSMLPLLGLEF